MARLSRVDIPGGGPGGLYTAIPVRRTCPDLPLICMSGGPNPRPAGGAGALALRGRVGEDALALQAHAKHNLMSRKYPRRIVFMPELSETGTGKIDRKAAADMLQAGG